MRINELSTLALIRPATHVDSQRTERFNVSMRIYNSSNSLFITEAQEPFLCAINIFKVRRQES